MLLPRDATHGSSMNPLLITLTVVLALLFIAVATYVYIRKRSPPSYKTTKDAPSCRKILGFLGRINKRLRSDPDDQTSYMPALRSTANDTEMIGASRTNVDRNTSVRSVLTLPAYNPSLRPNERLIAREGERGGVDTVVEYPETMEEEEARREDEMEALFQIRQARRREQEERLERRRQRQEAREQGDWARVEQLRLEAQRRARDRSNSNVSAESSTSTLPQAASSRELIAEHHARTASRERRVSSVNYLDLGLARHDGSRLRAESMDSDNRPLLDNAASISGNAVDHRREGSSETTRTRSRFHLPYLSRHHRTDSADSSMTAESAQLHDRTPQSSSAGRSGSGSGTDPPILTPNDSEPSPPATQPPLYHEAAEDPPEYSSPTRDRNEDIPRLPSVRINTSISLDAVPAIEIEESTPITSSHTPSRDS